MAIFQVALVGRPNVGKSTLFNRLCQKKMALTDDMPGLTRDRREQQIECYDTPINLIDMAGFEEAAEQKNKILQRQMNAQIEQALKQADLILLILDGRAGLMPADEFLHKKILTYNVPILPLVNKVERPDSAGVVADFMRLGNADLFPISAEHGLGIDALRDRLSQLAQEAYAIQADAAPISEQSDQHTIKLVMMGRPNVGKSTIINRLLGEERVIVHDEAGTTRDALGFRWDWRKDGTQEDGTQDASIEPALPASESESESADDVSDDMAESPQNPAQNLAQKHTQKFMIFDTAGLRRHARIHERAEKLITSDALKAIRYAHLVAAVIDATEPLEKQELRLIRHASDEGRGIIILLNKWDKVKNSKEILQQVRDIISTTLPMIRHVPVITLSALHDKNLDVIAESCIQLYDLWCQRVSTSQLNQWLQHKLEQHSPPLVRGRRLKIRYMTQIKARPPHFHIFASGEVPTDYQRYLLAGLREDFGFYGVPLRITVRRGNNPYV